MPIPLPNNLILSRLDRAFKRRTVVNLMPAGGHEPDREGRAPQRRGRLAVAELATAAAVAPGREEDLETAQAAAHLSRQGVQGLEGVVPGDGLAEAAGVQRHAELCWVGGAVRSATWSVWYLRVLRCDLASWEWTLCMLKCRLTSEA